MKTYINPAMRVVQMEPTNVITTSVGTNGLNGFQGFGGNAGGLNADAPGRRRDIWSDR